MGGGGRHYINPLVPDVSMCLEMALLIASRLFAHRLINQRRNSSSSPPLSLLLKTLLQSSELI